MKWEDLKRSSNVEDLRSQGSGGRMNFGSGRGVNLLIPIIRFLMGTNIGYVVPDVFTHGTSAQRMEWFKRGFDKGTLEACNTGV
jgi:predicted metalloprotease